MELNSFTENYNDQRLEIYRATITAIVLGFIIITTIIGNLFVISAILLERNLQNVSNYLILSLAVADLLVACIVMPFSAIYEVNKEWRLGPELCDVWTSSDVLCCTASILHLVAIALDRYWAVTNIEYIHQRNARRICLMILIVWCMAFLVSIAPVIGWKDSDWESRIEKQHICLISQDLGYQIFATASSFYVPLIAILILYWRIYQVARKRIRRRQGPVKDNKSAPIPGLPRNPSAGGVITAAGGSGGIAAAVIAIIGKPAMITNSDANTGLTHLSTISTPERASAIITDFDDLNNTTTSNNYSQIATYHYQPQLFYRSQKKKKFRKEVTEVKRERKAAKTLSIITGAFVCCWLPFFILAILLPIYSAKRFNPLIVSMSLWLGYMNSTINPILYTIFSPEFRHAFKKLLFHRRSRRDQLPKSRKCMGQSL